MNPKRYRKTSSSRTNRSRRNPAGVRNTLRAEVRHLQDVVEANRSQWRGSIESAERHLGRSLSSGEINDLSRTPEAKGRRAAEGEARDAAEAAFRAYQAVSGVDDWLKSWLGHGLPAFDENMQKAELEAERDKRIAAVQGQLSELGARIQRMPEIAPEDFHVGDFGVSSVSGMPQIFQVEKVTHAGKRVMARGLVGAKALVKLTPSYQGAYGQGKSEYRRIPESVADEYVQLWRVIYEPARTNPRRRSRR